MDVDAVDDGDAGEVEVAVGAPEVWSDGRLVADPRIDHDDGTVRRLTEVLHAAEPHHMHDVHTMVSVCIFCARRATLAVRTVLASDPCRVPVGFVPRRAQAD